MWDDIGSLNGPNMLSLFEKAYQEKVYAAIGWVFMQLELFVM